jgi:hypothetical protein
MARLNRYRIVTTPVVDTFRGWRIYTADFRGRKIWVARKAGVSMNTNSYEGIISMIRTKPR